MRIQDAVMAERQKGPDFENDIQILRKMPREKISRKSDNRLKTVIKPKARRSLNTDWKWALTRRETKPRNERHRPTRFLDSRE